MNPGRGLGTAWQLTVWATDIGIWSGDEAKQRRRWRAAPHRACVFFSTNGIGGQQKPLLPG